MLWLVVLAWCWALFREVPLGDVGGVVVVVVVSRRGVVALLPGESFLGGVVVVGVSRRGVVAVLAGESVLG